MPIKYFPNVSQDTRIDTINIATKLAKYFKQAMMVLTYELGAGDTENEVTEL